jgi:iron(III) transport system ATP-binding protein
MPSVSIVDLVKIHRVGRATVRAVDRVSLDAPHGKVLTLLGPSGCGKSTTLRCVAGLERPDDGEILFDDRVMFSRARRTFTPPDRRNVGMVFQSYAIWPHLTVFENVAYPMEVRRRPRREIQDRVGAALALVGLDGLEGRPAPYLSGGQQQRVALARALVYEPEVLLLDEPLSNLDAKIRESVREDLRALQRRLGITTVYVTHDQLEALALSDVVAVMHLGRIVEVGTPQELYARPQTRFTATFLGEISYVTGTAEADGESTVTVRTPWGPVRGGLAATVSSGAPVVAGIRPEHVTLSSQRPPGAPNVLAGTVMTTSYEGTRVKYRVAVGDLTILAYGAPHFSAGEQIHVAIDPTQVIVLPDLPADVTPPVQAPV